MTINEISKDVKRKYIHDLCVEYLDCKGCPLSYIGDEDQLCENREDSMIDRYYDYIKKYERALKDPGIAVVDGIPRDFIKSSEKFISNAAVESAQKIKDSGNRREFETGAVRDMAEGKGRCDLMPLDILGCCMGNNILSRIEAFKKTGDYQALYGILQVAKDIMDWSSWSDMFLDLAKHFEAGAVKYGENNWQKGIETWCYIDSATRHYLKWVRKDDDEPHDRAFIWNIICCIWTCINKPELNTYKKG